MTANEKYVLKSTDVALGYLKILHRIPSIFRGVAAITKLNDNMQHSWGKLLEQSAVKFKHNTALKYGDSIYTYSQLNKMANQYAHFFHAQGIEKGMPVNLLLDNRPELLIIYCALAKLGAVSVFINPNTRGDSLLYCAALHGCRYIIVGEEMWDAYNAVKDRLDQTCFYVSGERRIQCDLPDIREAVLKQNDTNITNDTLKLGDTLAYVFTSGTTGGKPKAAVIVNRRILSAVIWFGSIVQKTRPSDTVYCPLPFYHTNGLSVGWPTAIANGAALAFRKKFSVREFLSDVRKFNATILIYIGELPRYLMNAPATPHDSKNPLTTIIGNGLRPDIWSVFKKRFGIKKVFELYGAAESMWIFTNILNLNNTVGINLQTFAVVAYDPQNEQPVSTADGHFQKVTPGEIGLLIFEISETYKFAGYSDTAETGKKIFRGVFQKDDAWFNTGDLVRDIGYRHIQFVDRVGDTFRFKGENVSTTEVEKTLNTIDGITNACAYGVTLPQIDGRIGMAAITLDNGTSAFDGHRVYTHLSTHLPHYAIPHFIRVRSALETTATYKNAKYTLKNEGVDINAISDPIYVLLPNETAYTPLNEEIYTNISNLKYRF